jgi:hypothetical protein
MPLIACSLYMIQCALPIVKGAEECDDFLTWVLSSSFLFGKKGTSVFSILPDINRGKPGFNSIGALGEYARRSYASYQITQNTFFLSKARQIIKK